MKRLNPSGYLLEQKDQLKQLIAQLKEEFLYVSVLGTDVTGTSIRVSTAGFNVSPSSDEERGFVVRVFQDSGFSEYSFNELDVASVVEAVRQTAKEDRARFLRTSPVLPYPKAPLDEPLKREWIMEAEVLPEEIDKKEVLSRLSDIHDRVKAKHPQVVQLGLYFMNTQVNKIFLSTNRDLYQSYMYTNVYTQAVAADEEKTKYSFLSSTGLAGAELLDNAEELAEQASADAIELLSAEKTVPGVYDLICDPDFTGLLAHEAFGHGAEMDMFVKDRAKGREYIDKRVGSDILKMHDGANAYKEVSSYLFDDEGQLGGDTLIIDRGILKTGMCDELSALLLDHAPTGNGKRESYKRKAYTRMTNTFFEGGEDSLDEMIASIDHGFLLEGLDSGMEDPKNWGCQCVASRGREIKGGKLTGKVISPVYLTGYVPDLLQSISMISPEVKLSGSGYCGKGWKEWVKTSTGGSYIKMRGRIS